jgi:hypothetical protein
MPVNAIVIFNFYKLNEFFNERHAKALESQSAGHRWGWKARKHITKALERAYTHEATCFDHETGSYEVVQRGGTTSDGEVRESRRHVVVIDDFHALVVDQGNTTFHVLIWWQRATIATLVGRA